jgi:hypothetical protein
VHPIHRFQYPKMIPNTTLQSHPDSYPIHNPSAESAIVPMELYNLISPDSSY